MPDYNKGKIYAIVPKGVKLEDANGNVYIGSTTDMTRRKSKHVCQFKLGISTSSSRNLFKQIGVDNCEFIILEHYPCNSRLELTIREQMYINANPCVNEIRAFIDVETKKIQKKTLCKLYNEKHKSEKKAYDKLYAENNKHRRNESIKCECGCYIRRGDISRHKKRNKHINLMNQV